MSDQKNILFWSKRKDIIIYLFVFRKKILFIYVFLDWGNRKIKIGGVAKNAKNNCAASLIFTVNCKR